MEEIILYDLDITYCIISFNNDIINPESQITISGWRFTNNKNVSKPKAKDACSLLNRREHTSERLKQEKYCRFTFPIVTSNGEYKDRHFIMNVVSILYSFALTYI